MPKPPGTAEDVWLVVRFLKSERKGLVLIRDHILKLGRVRYRVKEINSGVEEQPQSCTDTASSDDDIEHEDIPGEHEESTCRICYEKQADKDNPLLSHCKCDGSVKYTHLQCLKQWLRSKVSIRTSDSSTTYQWKSLECEICKTELPLTLKSKGGLLSLFDFDKPSTPYIVLEAVPSERSAAKAMHVISMSNKPSIRLGRGHDSDVRINDISVSRCHALIHFEAGSFLIEDNNSKFGTLVRLANALVVDTDITLQIGRSLVSVESKETSKELNGDMRELPREEAELIKPPQ